MEKDFVFKFTRTRTHTHTHTRTHTHTYISISIYIYIDIDIYLYIYIHIYREGWRFEHSMSQLQVCLSADGAKNVSWTRISLVRGWCSLTMAFTSKFVYMTYHFIFLRLNPFDPRVDREEWWFEHSMS